MSDIAIKVEKLSKMYRLGDIGTGTLSRDLTSWWAKYRGKEDPNSKIAIANDRSKKATSDFVWSLQDINFEIKKGDAVGIIGKNGAGKSTLLKILSRTTSPTSGKICINGRVASLLEVGTGFHGDLSGKENIFMNGALLGMSRREIASKLEEIVEFSGVAGYIDTPVKRYSSGMYVRLAFAVAAHLEPDILIVDEVLSVGDLEFQKKCMGKMQDVNNKDGRTVLFVSHNLGAIKELCNKGILLKNGRIELEGSTNIVLSKYLIGSETSISATEFLHDATIRRGNGEVRFTNILINNGSQTLDPFEDIKISFEAIVNTDVEELYFSILIRTPNGTDECIGASGLICISQSKLFKGQVIESSLRMPKNLFRTGAFPLYLWLGKRGDLAADNYPYDLIDSYFNLNFRSDRSSKELGYNSENPSAFINLAYQIEQIKIN
ncbi:MAG: ABC transporter ATP-binding protein [Opitutaceae bacterium]|nr:ABC transporter ATP-binding protein [Cytophagales bacterium]